MSSVSIDKGTELEIKNSKVGNLNRVPVQLEWRNIKYTVQKPIDVKARSKPCKKVPTEDFTILNGLDGIVKPGQTLAIMGPSGSGKTTLLNVLSGIIPHKKWQGEVKLNGSKCNKKALQAVSAYVPQEDILFGSQTVREAVDFYAALRLHGEPKHEVQERVVELIDELGLTKVKNSLIGYVGSDAARSGLDRGISGGERKRLSIAQQLVSNPSLLFLDEPTTGLDSFAAESVVRTLHEQAMQGRTVVFTIHQPSTDVMKYFDHLMVLGHGRLMYYGPFDKSLDYFSNIGYPCPRDENPGDFFLELLHKDPDAHKKKEDEAMENLFGEDTGYEKTHERAEELSKKFAKSKYHDALQNPKGPKVTAPISSKHSGKGGFFPQMAQLFKRNIINTIREPNSLRVLVIQSIIFSLIMGLVYLQIEHTQKGLNDLAGSVFFACMFIMFGGMLGPFHLFPMERKQFLFQSREGLYTTYAYFLARTVVELPKFFFNSLLFSAIFYWLIGLKAEFGAFVLFVVFGFLISVVAYSFASVIVAAFPDPAIAMTVFPMIFIPMMIFSGFYQNSANTPVYFIWAEYLSFMKYTFRAMMNNELQGSTWYCTAEELKTNSYVCPYTSGDQWLKFRGLDDMPIYGDALILVLFIVVLLPIAWGLMHRMSVKSKS